MHPAQSDRLAFLVPFAMRPTIAVCIPTHGRPELAREALESVLAQTLPPSEVLVSDDCDDAATRAVVEDAARRVSCPVRYLHCQDGPGQAENVNHCLRAVRSDLLLLLHDDDLLLPRCLELLLPPFLSEHGLVASYGSQIVVDHAGCEVPGETRTLNARHHRTQERTGLQPCSLCAGILGQFPNDAFLIRADVATAVGYGSAWGAATDRDFGIRCAEHGRYFYTGEPVSKYRLSHDSIIRGKGESRDDSAFMFARLLEELHPADAGCRETATHCYQRILPAAIAQAARLRRIRTGWRWYFSQAHAWRIFTPGGIRRAILLLKATFSRSRPQTAP